MTANESSVFQVRIGDKSYEEWLLASSSRDKTLRVWSEREGRCVHVIKVRISKEFISKSMSDVFSYALKDFLNDQFYMCTMNNHMKNLHAWSSYEAARSLYCMI